jgi:hypothetical protein
VSPSRGEASGPPQSQGASPVLVCDHLNSSGICQHGSVVCPRYPPSCAWSVVEFPFIPQPCVAGSFTPCDMQTAAALKHYSRNPRGATHLRHERLTIQSDIQLFRSSQLRLLNSVGEGISTLRYLCMTCTSPIRQLDRQCSPIAPRLGSIGVAR